MHIPDGWLSLPVILFSWAVVVYALGRSFSRVKETDIEQVSNIGSLAAVVFVAQMFNFPVAGGTSGHLLGAALAVYVVGLPGAVISIFSVLLVQAVVFADGGILVLGANTMNMGIVGGLIAQGVKKIFPEEGRIYYAGTFVAGFSAVILSSFVAGVELVISNTGLNPLFTLGSILFWHTLIGIGEGVLTTFIIVYLKQVGFKFEAVEVSGGTGTNRKIAGVAVLLLTLSVLSLFASSSPDGLEYVGGKMSLGSGSYFKLGLADDYAFLGMNNVLGTLLSAALGATILLGILTLPTLYLKEKRRSTTVVN